LEVIKPRILSEEKESKIRPSLKEMLEGQVKQVEALHETFAALSNSSAQLHAENQALVIENAELTVKLRHDREQGQAIGHMLPEHQQDFILRLAEAVLEKEELLKRIDQFEEDALLAEQKKLKLEEFHAKTQSRETGRKLRSHIFSATAGALATGLLYSLYNRDSFSPPVIGVGLETPPATGGVVNSVNVTCPPAVTIDGPELAENTTLRCIFRGSKHLYKLVREQLEKE
jgi:hypothetical protein